LEVGGNNGGKYKNMGGIKMVAKLMENGRWNKMEREATTDH
jgi:hypothetical protein